MARVLVQRIKAHAKTADAAQRRQGLDHRGRCAHAGRGDQVGKFRTMGSQELLRVRLCTQHGGIEFLGQIGIKRGQRHLAYLQHAWAVGGSHV